MSRNGHIAFITGGGSGIGRITARRWADEGGTVVIADLNEAGMAETAQGYPSIHCVALDVTKRRNVASVIADVVKTHGPIDRLVHCAAMMPLYPVLEHSAAQAMKLMEINYGGTLNIIHAALPAMLARDQGELIVYGSIAGIAPAPAMGCYGATKAAVNLLVETLAVEHRDSNVYIGVVCPPMTNTPLLKQAEATANPALVRMGIEQGHAADPFEVVENVERGVRKRKVVIFPHVSATVLAGLRRVSPKLLWNIVLKAEEQANG